MNELVPLGEVCSFRNGGTPSKSADQYFRGDIPWITGADIVSPVVTQARSFITQEAIDNSATNLVPRGTVLLVTRTSIGKVAIAGMDLCFSQDITALNPNSSRVHRPYLVEFLRTKQPYFERLARGATIKGLTREMVSELEIPLPPLQEQRRIAEILDRAEALRAKRRTALAQLDTLTQSIFLDLFGDPITNPRGWPEQNLETFFHFRTGKLDSNAAKLDGQYPFFTCSRDDARIDTFAFDCEALLLAGNNASADYSVKHYRGKFNAYQRTYVITLRNDGNSYEYARFVLERRLGELKRISKGTNTKYLTLELLNKIRISVPPERMQNDFARRIAAVDKLRTMQLQSLTKLHVLFTSIQGKAFRGQL